MPDTSSSFDKNLEIISKIAPLSTQIGFFIGGICVLGYSLRIDHFPQGISIGDGLLFLVAAACFGFIYIAFVASLVALGIVASPIIRPVFKAIFFVKSRFSKRKLPLAHEFAPFEWSALALLPIAIMFILVLGKVDSAVYWGLSGIAISLYLFYSIYKSCENKIKSNGILYTEEKEKFIQAGDFENYRKVQLFCLFVIFGMPLFVGGVSGNLLDAAMRGACIRIEKPILYIKEPYVSLIPNNITSFVLSSPEGYVAFDKAVVLLKGFGSTTVISFSTGSSEKKLEIPNDHIIVVRR